MPSAQLDKKATINLADYSGGEFGLLGEVHAARNSFTGENVLRGIDGSLMPRSGLVNLGVTGVPAGIVLGFGVHPYARKAWFVVGTTVYQFALDVLAPAAVSVGTLGAAVSGRLRSLVNRGNKTYISNYGDKVYAIDHVAGTLTPYASAPGGRAVTIFADRMIVAGIAGHENRVRFSAWRDFSRFPTANFVDIGSSDYAITAVQQSYHQLIVAKEDGSWWSLGGVPPISESYYELIRNERAGDRTNGVTRTTVAGGDSIWFVAPRTDSPTHFASYIPRRGQATGRYSHYQPEEHLSLSDRSESFADAGATPTIGATGLYHDNDVVFVSGAGSPGTYNNRALLYQRGMWSKHVFGVNISGWIDGRDDPARRVVLCDGGVSGAAKFYRWAYDLNRPAFAGPGFESLGDASTTPPACDFTLPEIMAPDLSEMSVIGVVVDFKKWAHGFSSNNTITIEVTPTHRDGSGDGTTKTNTFSQAATAAATGGTSTSVRLTIDSAGFASGFRLKVSGIVGCAIQRLHVFYDTRAVQGI